MTSEAVGSYNIIPIGRVVSSVGEGDEMPIDGVPASIEVFPEYEAGLAGIESNTHLFILGWFHRADRNTLTLALSHRGRGNRMDSSLDAYSTGTEAGMTEKIGRGRGVFGLRAPGRPNPVGLTSARVLGVEGRVVRLDWLDMIDGTPIVDFKRYSPGWDSIFSARTSRDMEHPGDRNRASFLRDMLFEAVNFHGVRCVGAAIGGEDGRPCDIPLGHRQEGACAEGRVGPRRLHQRRFAGDNRRNLRQWAIGFRCWEATTCFRGRVDSLPVQASGGVGSGGGFERGCRGGDGGGGVGHGR